MCVRVRVIVSPPFLCKTLRDKAFDIFVRGENKIVIIRVLFEVLYNTTGIPQCEA